jgi:hypothetical protein
MVNPVIVYCQPNSNKVAICTPVLDSGLTVQEIAKKDVPQDCPYVICEADLLPTDNSFFDAWVYDMAEGEVPIGIDVEAAHQLWKNEWRSKREPIMKRLDVEWMRAMEMGNTELAQTLAHKKQVLRDVTLIQLPNRMEDDSVSEFTNRVKQVWPECLTW